MCPTYRSVYQRKIHFLPLWWKLLCNYSSILHIMWNMHFSIYIKLCSLIQFGTKLAFVIVISSISSRSLHNSTHYARREHKWFNRKVKLFFHCYLFGREHLLFTGVLCLIMKNFTHNNTSLITRSVAPSFAICSVQSTILYYLCVCSDSDVWTSLLILNLIIISHKRNVTNTSK